MVAGFSPAIAAAAEINKDDPKAKKIGELVSKFSYIDFFKKNRTRNRDLLLNKALCLRDTNYKNEYDALSEEYIVNAKLNEAFKGFVYENAPDKDLDKMLSYLNTPRGEEFLSNYKNASYFDSEPQEQKLIVSTIYSFDKSVIAHDEFNQAAILYNKTKDLDAKYLNENKTCKQPKQLGN